MIIDQSSQRQATKRDWRQQCNTDFWHSLFQNIWIHDLPIIHYNVVVWFQSWYQALFKAINNVHWKSIEKKSTEQDSWMNLTTWWIGIRGQAFDHYSGQYERLKPSGQRWIYLLFTAASIGWKTPTKKQKLKIISLAAQSDHFYIIT